MKIVGISVFFLVFVVVCHGQQSLPDDTYVKYYNIKVTPTSSAARDFVVVGNHDRFYYKPFNFLLWFYSRVLSEQISSDCDFSPSCSRFSYQAIREFGLVKGIFITADRLTRCNGSANTVALPYLFDSKNAKIIDSPSFYRMAE